MIFQLIVSIVIVILGLNIFLWLENMKNINRI
jgi:nitrogen fixation-related uncharacterized protein